MTRRMRRAVAAALATGALVTATGYAVEISGAAAADALGPGRARIDLSIDRSRFSVERITVHQGTLLELHLRNDDPIAHELVVGDEDVHRAHEGGTERRHPPRPGEVSVGPGQSGMTFVVLEEPGTLRFVCHLPGHEAYGMRGEIEVLPVP